MKQAIMAVLLLITVSKGMAQTNVKKNDAYAIQFNTTGKFTPIGAMIKNGSDTLEIFEPLQFHFIKIGKEVYQIVPHNTTIEKVEKSVMAGWGTGILIDTGFHHWNGNPFMMDAGPSNLKLSPQ